MNKDEIFEKVKDCIAEAVPCAEVLPSLRLKEDIGLDSLNLTVVIVELEEKLGIMFDDGDLDPSKIITVQDLADLVSRYV